MIHTLEVTMQSLLNRQLQDLHISSSLCFCWWCLCLFFPNLIVQNYALGLIKILQSLHSTHPSHIFPDGTVPSLTSTGCRIKQLMEGLAAPCNASLFSVGQKVPEVQFVNAVCIPTYTLGGCILFKSSLIVVFPNDICKGQARWFSDVVSLRQLFPFPFPKSNS